MCGLGADEGWTGVTVAEFPDAGLVCSMEGVVWTDDSVEVEHEASMTHPVTTATGTTTRQRQSWSNLLKAGLGREHGNVLIHPG